MSPWVSFLSRLRVLVFLTGSAVTVKSNFYWEVPLFGSTHWCFLALGVVLTYTEWLRFWAILRSRRQARGVAEPAWILHKKVMFEVFLVWVSGSKWEKCEAGGFRLN